MQLPWKSSNVEISFFVEPSLIVQHYAKMKEVASSVGRIYQHAKNRNMGAMSAFRNENSLKENRERNEKLKAMIRKAGYGFIKVKGRYIENEGTDKETTVDEESFMVIGDNTNEGADRLNAFLKEAAIEFDQESVLLKKHDEKDAKLVFYNGPAKGTEFNVGEFRPTNIGPYFSSLKKGKSFEFMDEETKKAILKKKKEERERKEKEALKKKGVKKNNEADDNVVTQSDMKWWKSMSRNQRRKYIERHPTSKYKNYL